VLLGFVIAVTAIWGYVLLGRTPTWFPMLRGVLLVAGLAVALVVVIAPALRGRVAVVLALAAIGLGLAAPTAYTLSTVAQPHSGSLPTAGPAGVAIGRGGPGGARRFAGGAPPAGLGANPGTFTPGAFGGGFPGGGTNGGRPNGGGLGGLLRGSTPSAAITTLFRQSTGFRWTAAAIGANNASGYQLASGKAVMAIGGFNGTDPTPTLAQFEQYVRTGQIHYFIASGGGGGPGGGSASTSTAITQWVEQHFTAQTVGGTTIYDLSATPSP
jgi:hypothetical protein